MFVVNSLIVGVATFLVALFVRFRWSRRRFYQLAAKIPGPKGLPIIGSAHKFMTTDPQKMFNTINNMPNGYESSVMKIWIGPELMVFAHTPESLQIVLNSKKCLHKSKQYDVLLLDKGLIVGSGQTWKNHRKILNPAFGIGILQKLIPTFDEKSKIFVKNLKCEVNKKPFDVYEYMSACSLETLLKSTMDIDRDVQSDPHNFWYLKCIEM